MSRKVSSIFVRRINQASALLRTHEGESIVSSAKYWEERKKQTNTNKKEIAVHQSKR
jgi:hypothetical protein